MTIRNATIADEQALVDLINAVFPEFEETLDDLRTTKHRLREADMTIRYGVAEGAGAIVGYWQYQHMMSQYDPARYRLVVATHPASRRRGLGVALFDHAIEGLRARRAQALESFARETDTASIGFLTRRGFAETMRTWEYRLDLTRFDPTPFAPNVERARRAGIVITTLDEERRRDARALRRAYDLHIQIHADIPAPIPYTPISFARYVAWATEDPRALPDGYFIAKIDDTYAGEANLRRAPGSHDLHHAVTGVLPAHRHRGIATVLKLATIAYGQARGCSVIRTWNEHTNAGMLAINDRLGFARMPAWLTLERALLPPEATA